MVHTHRSASCQRYFKWAKTICKHTRPRRVLPSVTNTHRVPRPSSQKLHTGTMGSAVTVTLSLLFIARPRCPNMQLQGERAQGVRAHQPLTRAGHCISLLSGSWSWSPDRGLLPGFISLIPGCHQFWVSQLNFTVLLTMNPPPTGGKVFLRARFSRLTIDSAVHRPCSAHLLPLILREHMKEKYILNGTCLYLQTTSVC